jgi:hypothetical protein
MQKDPQIKSAVEARDEVLARYQPVFSPEGIAQLTAEEFRDFLMFRNNRHWSGLQRMGPRTTEDMDALRNALTELLTEAIPVNQRLDRLLPDGVARVKKLGKAILTPILLIAHPDRYGVWNGTSEGAMEQLGIWPEINRGTSVGNQYVHLNALLLKIANDLSVDLWTLDALWWQILQEEPGDGKTSGVSVDDESTDQQFGLERHLHEFLLENWDMTELGKEWNLVEEGGDIKGYGYERPTDVGKIDLLARHKTDRRWLVIELKRDQTSDDTVGQVLRYMGWVQEKIAASDDKVEGLIIGLNDDLRLRYALKPTPNIRFRRYAVQFRLVDE